LTDRRFAILPLDGRDRSGFTCQSEALTRYFRQQAGQDTRRRVAACYIAVEQGTGAIAGYYTLSAADIPVGDAPPELVRRLPRYPTLPAARLGRLAVASGFTGLKLGAALVADAAKRAGESELAVFALVVDAKDDKAVAFYRHLGFVSYLSDPRTLLAPLTSFLPKT
jgi:ribosomal protein S18 acetylase RimI-like enzyme